MAGPHLVWAKTFLSARGLSAWLGANISTDKSKGSKSSSPLREGKNTSRNGKLVKQSNTKDSKKVATLIDTQESKKAAEMIRMIDLVEAKVNNFD